MTNVKFQVEEHGNPSKIKATIWAVVEGNKVMAGTVQLFEWNNGAFVRPEPFDRKGERISTGSQNFNDHIETVKNAYISHLEYEQAVKENYQSHKKLIDELGVSWELYHKYGNVRIYINNIGYVWSQWDGNRTTLTQLFHFRDSAGFNENLPAVKKTIIDKIEELKKEVEGQLAEIEKYKTWIGEYSL
jgi:hypothetical protein